MPWPRPSACATRIRSESPSASGCATRAPSHRATRTGQAWQPARAWASAATRRPVGESLPALVERWSALDDAALARLLRLRAAYVEVKRALKPGGAGWNEVERIVSKAKADIDAAPWSTMAIDTAALGVVALARRGRTADIVAPNQALVERCLALGWRRAAASLMGRVASAHRDLGRIDDASKAHARARAIYEALDRKADAAGVLADEARLDTHRNRLDAAEEKLERARTILEASGAKRRLTPVLTRIGNLARARGRMTEALTAYTRMLQISREIGDDEGIVIGLANSANVHSDTWRYEQARSLSEQARRPRQRNRGHSRVSP